MSVAYEPLEVREDLVWASDLHAGDWLDARGHLRVTGRLQSEGLYLFVQVRQRGSRHPVVHRLRLGQKVVVYRKVNV